MFGCKQSKVCVVHNSPGGIVQQFQQAVAEAQSEGVQLIIRGYCGSACESVLAPSANACTERNTVFVRHSPRMELPQNHIEGLGYFTGDEQTLTASRMVAEGKAHYCNASGVPGGLPA
jgi:hypothetical protein